jgi:hypothetical protein
MRMVSKELFLERFGFFIWLGIPIAVWRIRKIQRRYKHITLNNNRSDKNTTELILLQAKEYCYEKNFRAWGKYSPKFSYTQEEYVFQRSFIDWLFPLKDFEESPVVVSHNPKAVVWYHNQMFNNKRAFDYESDSVNIKKQLKKWRENEFASCPFNTKRKKQKG